ncbi:MAG: hypothetical protein G01um101472_9 [Parcubacteria group bacterium Gr01-1014_72]|nr:MAG: hypothetical protein G01um101472_9 [Parcubacteria group bacterium Gr01-1014_72]
MENEIAIFESAIRTKDPERLRALGPILDGYKSITSATLQTPAPQGAETLHAEFLTSLSRVTAVIEALSLLFEDPVRAAEAINAYQGAAESLHTALKKLDAYFIKSGVFFNRDEGGSVIAGSI